MSSTFRVKSNISTYKKAYFQMLKIKLQRALEANYQQDKTPYITEKQYNEFCGCGASSFPCGWTYCPICRYREGKIDKKEKIFYLHNSRTNIVGYKAMVISLQNIKGTKTLLKNNRNLLVKAAKDILSYLENKRLISLYQWAYHVALDFRRTGDTLHPHLHILVDVLDEGNFPSDEELHKLYFHILKRHGYSKAYNSCRVDVKKGIIPANEMKNISAYLFNHFTNISELDDIEKIYELYKNMCMAFKNQRVRGTSKSYKELRDEVNHVYKWRSMDEPYMSVADFITEQARVKAEDEVWKNI